jgi:hypothetical protein
MRRDAAACPAGTGPAGARLGTAEAGPDTDLPAAEVIPDTDLPAREAGPGTDLPAREVGPGTDLAATGATTARGRTVARTGRRVVWTAGPVAGAVESARRPPMDPARDRRTAVLARTVRPARHQVASSSVTPSEVGLRRPGGETRRATLAGSHELAWKTAGPGDAAMAMIGHPRRPFAGPACAAGGRRYIGGIVDDSGESDPLSRTRALRPAAVQRRRRRARRSRPYSSATGPRPTRVRPRGPVAAADRSGRRPGPTDGRLRRTPGPARLSSGS